MSKEEYRNPYLVEGGEMEEIINQIASENEAVYNRWEEFKKALGFEAYYANDAPVGAVFPNREIPEGWVHRKKDPSGVVVPKMRTALRKEFDTLPRKLTAHDLQKRIKCPFHMVGLVLPFAAVEEIGDQIVVWIPKPALEKGYVPPGKVRELKMSEYWALKENVEKQRV